MKSKIKAEWYEDILEALGAENITSKTQKKNGTSMWRLKTGETVAEYSTGYVRKIRYYIRMSDNRMLQDTCWQLNPTRTYPASWKSPETGNTYNWKGRERIMLNTRQERLEKIVNYATKKILKKVA